MYTREQFPYCLPAPVFYGNLNYDYLHKVAHEQVGLQAVWNDPC